MGLGRHKPTFRLGLHECMGAEPGRSPRAMWSRQAPEPSRGASRSRHTRHMDIETAAGSGSELDAEATNRLRLQNDEDDIIHIVCCRDPKWEAAFCGSETDVINLTGNTVCTMWTEVARPRDSEFGRRDPAICPIDLTPCPDEHEIDLRILREVNPR